MPSAVLQQPTAIQHQASKTNNVANNQCRTHTYPKRIVPAVNMTRATPWTPARYQGIIIIGGQTSPSRPRPPKPIQPRDDGQSRKQTVCYGGNDGPQPRDPGNGRRLQFDPQPRDPGNGQRLYFEPQPRDPGNGQQLFRGPQPRDDGSNGCFSINLCKPPREPRPPQPREGGKKRTPRETQPRDPGM